MSQPQPGFESPVVLIPIYDDWEALSALLEELESSLADQGVHGVRVLLVDDASTVDPPLERLRPRGVLGAVRLLRLRRNLGHQRAIAIGLTYVYQQMPAPYCVVMDGDGEDDPHDVPRLLRRSHEGGGREIVFAERSRRAESLWFKLGYRLYRTLHYLLTGIPVRVGNFSAVPRAALERLVVVSELWNHYAAAVFKARLPHATVPSARRARLAGESSMSFVGLVTHGLSAISVFGEVAGVRLLLLSLALCLLIVLAQLPGLVAGARSFATHPERILEGFGFLLLGVLQALVMISLFVFMILSGRQNPAFLPLRDFQYYVLDSRDL